jgi:hypothetical protein
MNPTMSAQINVDLQTPQEIQRGASIFERPDKQNTVDASKNYLTLVRFKHGIRDNEFLRMAGGVSNTLSVTVLIQFFYFGGMVAH